MTSYRCGICGYLYDEAKEGVPWDELPGDWVCPVCGAQRSEFVREESDDAPSEAEPAVEEAQTEAVASDDGWYKVAEPDSLSDRQPTVVSVGSRSVALTRIGDEYGAIDNYCPHQGGPLGEGTVDEEGHLRCPWHGWGFCPTTGEGKAGSKVDSFPVEVRDDGVYVKVDEPEDEVATICDVMAQTMVNWGVTHVFGMVGHSNLGLAEAIRKLEAQGKLTFIGIRHEGAASFACSGFAKASGRPAACLTIAGPGATNLLTGLWDAKVDRVPVLALTGQVDTQVLGPGAFQEIDLASAFQAATAWSQTVLPSSDHAELMSLALKNSVVQRDVGHLIFPDEVQKLPAADDAGPSGPEGRIGDPLITPAKASLDQATDLIAKSQRPAIIVGYGAKTRMEQVIALAERLNAPVITTFKGKGQIPDDHPLATGVLGRSGTPVSSRCMTEADLLLVFGASFAVHTGIDQTKPTIQVDYDRMTLGKFHPVEVPVWGEIGLTAELLLDQLPTSAQPDDQREKIRTLKDEWREEKQRRAAKDQGRGINSAIIFEHLTRTIPEDAVIAVDVGNNTYSFGRYFECKRQSVLMSGYLGSIGFGFPAAMGAWAACPDRPTVCLTGDGGFGQYMGEFTTAVKYRMNLTHVLLNNNELGKITKEQRAGNWPVWQTSLQNPSFAEYARNCGGLGIRVSLADDLPAAMEEALAYEGPALVEVMSDAELV